MPNCQKQIVECLKRAQINVAAYLPELWFGDVMTEIVNDPAFTYVRVAREDEGIGICAGAYLGGKRAVMIMQNSGLLLSANALVNVAHINKTPFLGLISYRGNINEKYFYQIPQGRVTEDYLKALQVPFVVVDTPEKINLVEEAAHHAYASSEPYMVLLTKGVLCDE